MSSKLLNLLLLVASFAVYYVVISPLYSGDGQVWKPEQGVASLMASNKQYEKTVAQADTLYLQANELRTQYSAIDDDAKQKINVMVPKNIDAIRLLSEFNIIASGTGISPSAVTYTDTPQTKTSPGAYKIAFTVTTTYEKFKEFMRAYEKSLRLYSLQSVTFSSPDEKTGLITFQVELNTFYLQ